MKRLIFSALSLLLVAACSGSAGPYANPSDPHAMLDFNAPVSKVMAVRLATLDGHNNMDAQRRTFPVSPGTHEVVVIALGSDSLVGSSSLQAITGSVKKTDPGKFTITVEAGIRYFIAAEATNDQGGWKPIIYKETYLDGPNKGKVVPDKQ